MKLSLLTLAFAVLAFLPQSFAMDMDKGKAHAGVKAVMFYSDSCGSCKILDPRVNAALEAINQDRLEIVKLDFSSKEAIIATKALAAEKNIDHILQEYGAKTGFVVLVNDKGEEVGKLKVQDETPDIAAKMAMAIANLS